tara:strand:- start:11 stop:376 length:366 start_codon:yes stop_codon:yes gene_type:complete
MIKKTIEKFNLGLKVLAGLLVVLMGVLAVYYGVQVWVLELFLVLLGVALLREVIRGGIIKRKVDLVVSIGLVLFGLVPILLTFRFLPWVIDLELSVWVLALIVVFYGLYVIVDNVLDMFGF